METDSNPYRAPVDVPLTIENAETDADRLKLPALSPCSRVENSGLGTCLRERSSFTRTT